MHDIVIIGGGAAGMTAGLYAARAGFDALLLESSGLTGGQAATTDMLMNYPGFPSGIGGPELMMNFEAQARSAGLKYKNTEVTSLELTGDVKRVHTPGGVIEGRCAILAMGASRRRLGVPGEDENIGRGVSYCSTCDGALYRGRTVAVVGGGNTAVEDVAYLSNICDVLWIHRRDKLRARGADAAHALASSRVRMVFESVVSSVERRPDDLLDLHISAPDGGARPHEVVSALFVSIGTDPNTDLVLGQVATDEDGYIAAGEDTATNIPGVFAAGDIRKKPLKQVITAASDGAVAAYSAGRYLEIKVGGIV